MLKKVIRRILKTILWLIVSLVVLDLMIVALVLIPPVQQFLVLKASKILTNITGGEITVDKIYLSPTLTLTAKNFAIKDYQFENMIFATTLKGKINIAKTMKGQLCFTFAELDDGEVVIRKYEGESKVNIAIWALGLKKKEKKEPKFKLLIENISLNNVRFVFINDDKRLYKDDNTIDYAFFELQRINLNVENFLVWGPDISCKIKSLTLSQYTGFEISNFSGNFRIYSQGLLVDSLHFSTPNSMFSGDFAFRYNDFPDFTDFVNLINFDTKVKSASISMKDIVFFVPKLKGMDNQFIFSGHVSGPVNHLQTKNVYLKYKQNTHIAGEFAVENILDFNNSSFNLYLKNANINFSELSQLKLPERKTIIIPKILDKLIYSKINGYFIGSLTKFNTNLAIQTNIGNADIEIKTKPLGDNIAYSGKIDCKEIALGNLMSQPKYLNKVNLQSSLEGNLINNGNIKDILSSISAKVQGRIIRMDICGYQLDDILFRGDYMQKKVGIALKVTDSLASFRFRGNLNFADENPSIVASLRNINIKLSELFSHFSTQMDSTTATGFEKLLLKVNQTPNLVFTTDSIGIEMSGSQIDNLNGFLRIDYAKLSNGEKSSRVDWLRLNAINKPNFHQYLIHTNLVNITFKTNYEHKDCITAISEAIQYYLPDFVDYKAKTNQLISSINTDHYINFDIHFFYSRNFFELIFPQLNIARNSSISIYLGNSRSNDLFNLSFPQINYTNLGKINNLNINGSMNIKDFFEMRVQCDSLTIYQKNNPLTFTNIDISTNINKKEIEFQTSWYNPKSFSVKNLNQLNGILYEDSNHNISLKITNSKLFARESMWQFMEDNNSVSFGKNYLKFDHCFLSSDIGKISINGEISKQSKKKCNILFENFDIALFNNFTSKMKMNFEGDLSLMATINSDSDRITVEGKTFVKNFVFNDELMGDIFLDANIFDDGVSHFSGGVFSSYKNMNINLSEFSLSDFSKLPNKMMELKGKLIAKDKEFLIHAKIDTLKIGFLSPFLASFSDIVSGEAYGDLDFVIKPDSLFFDGKVIVKKAQLGILPLNTVYYITDQEIRFNREGIDFKQVQLKDKFNNEATLSGYVHHNKFKDFTIDLNISTPRILALNTTKDIDSPFFGNGFVSGDISIQGNTKQLNFSSHNIKTLPGSTITFPLSSASSVSSSKGIYFVKNSPTKILETNISSLSQSTTLNYDFVFDVTRDADVKLELEPIDGILKCKTSGRLHLTYNSSSGNMNLDGILAIVSGKFNMSLKNFFPRDFSIVEGGTISFGGALSSAQLNVSALYQKSTSLNSLSPTLNGRTDVSAYMGLNGNLMNPNPSFTFEFPRLTNEEQFTVFAALDTANPQNGIRQFFSFVFLNTFITPESNMNVSQQSLGTGLDLMSSILTSFISNQLNNFSFGVNINNQENYKEYSVNAAVRFHKDRGVIKTNFGYAENPHQKSNNNFVADLSVEYYLNEEGNWRIRAFYFNDVSNTDVTRPQQGGGIGITFQQEFNNKKEFSENWKVKKKTKRKTETE
ncbi:MAG: translocation/assembly module TamB [Bacteroidales bacterium]|jgi:hypothetical protein|nr:translocation/assembly module TamB [Bacteroidales bacterium]